MRVLYLEDNARDADLTRQALVRRADHISLDVVHTVADCFERLDDGGADAYDLLLLDLHLPDGNGLDVLKEVQDRSLSLALVVVTGQGDEELAVSALKAGADDYVVKRPGYLDHLDRVLDDALQRRRADVDRQLHHLRVLYAEHHAADIDLALRHFRRHAPHITLDIAGNAADALRQIEQKPYDLLLLDYRLPGLNALELLKELSQVRDSDLPVVLVTGQGDQEVAIQALKLGATDYLIKNTGYLYRLPSVLEGAFHRHQLSLEQAALRESEKKLQAYSEQLEAMVEERTQALRAAQQELLLQERLAVLGRLAAAVGHELRNPLGVISNAIYYLHATLPQASATTREYLDIIDAEVDNAARIVADLIDFEHTPIADRTLVPIAPQVAQALDDHPAPGGVSVINDVGADLGCVCVDPSHLEMVLGNLITNAYQAMTTGGTLTLSARIEGEQLALAIADTGHGIASDDLETIFQPLYTTRARGIGLGLPLARNLVHANRGRIEVSSQEGKGSTFTLFMARAEDQADCIA